MECLTISLTDYFRYGMISFVYLIEQPVFLERMIHATRINELSNKKLSILILNW